MSIQRIQGEQSWFPEPVQGVYQFWFPEEVWEIIKEFIITPRSRLLLKMKLLSIPRLSNIFAKYFQMRVTNMNDSRTPLEQRKNVCKSGIIESCEKTPTRYAEIMENEFQVKPKKEKNYDWLNVFFVGEEVFVNRKDLRRGKITKITKTSILVLLDNGDKTIVKSRSSLGGHKNIWVSNL